MKLWQTIAVLSLMLFVPLLLAFGVSAWDHHVRRTKGRSLRWRDFAFLRKGSTR